MKKTIFSMAFIATVSFTSCVKDPNKNVVSSSVQQQNSETLISDFINAKYVYLESSSKNMELDNYFASQNLATTLEKEYEAEKKDLASTSVKYTSHATSVKIKSTTKNNDGSQTYLVEETTNLNTNQISELDGSVISSIKLQQYNITVACENNICKITNVQDLDKEILQHQKDMTTSVSLTQDELEFVQRLNKEMSVALITYKRNDALAYAAKYAITPNPLYQDFSPGLCSYCGGDCTNFVSQCLLAGNWTQRFYHSSKSYSWWYGKTSNPSGYKTGFAGPWVSATKFGVFFKNLTSRVTRVTSLSQLAAGDVVQLVNGSNGNAYHTLIVTQKATNGDLYLTCHTTNRYNAHMSHWNISSLKNYSGVLPYAFLWKLKNAY